MKQWTITLFEDSGSCPYQVSGRCGTPGDQEYYFYLRARWDEVRIEIYSSAAGLEAMDEQDLRFVDALFFREGERAGYINQRQAHSLLHFFIEGFYNNP